MKSLLLANLLLSSLFSLKEVTPSRIVVKFEGPEEPLTYAYTTDGREVAFPLGEIILPEAQDSLFLPYFELKVALNFEGTFSVKLKPIEKITFSPINLPTVPEFYDDGLSMKYSVYEGSSKIGEQVVYSGKTEIVNMMPVVRIYITPYLYDHHSKTLTYYKELEVEIYPQEKKKIWDLKNTWQEALFKESFLNYQGINPDFTPKQKQNPFLNSILWFQLKILEEGYYSVSYKDMEKAGLPYPVEFSKISLYARRSDTLPSNPSDTTAQMVEIPFEYKDQNQNGVFDGDDEILFYSKGPKGLRNSLSGSETTRDEILSKFYYFENPYTDTFCVWLGIGKPGAYLEEKNLSVHTTLNELYTFYHHEKNLQNIAWKGLLWVGEEIIRPQNALNATETFNLDLKDALQAPGYLWIRYVGGLPLARKVKITFNATDSLIDQFSNYVLRLQKLPLQRVLPTNTLRIELLPLCSTSQDLIYLDFFTLFYKKNTTNFSDEVAFYGEPDTQLVNMPVSSKVITVLDITDPLNPKKLHLTNNGVKSFADTLYPGKTYYFAVTIKKPVKIEMSQNAGSLYEITTNPEYIAITPKNFTSSLFKFKTYREKKLLKFVNGKWEVSQGKVEIVTVEDIMRDFAFGIYDPVAIRNFLLFQYQKSQGNLMYVGLWGDACYDYKNIDGTGGNLVPAYEPFLSTYIDEEVGARDDFYVDFNYDGYPDIMIGRIPFRTKEQISIFTDKLMKYEENAIFSSWRTRFLFVADDEYGESRQPTEIGYHIPLANYIRQDTTLTPPFCEVKLVYETSYGVYGNTIDLNRRGLEAKQDFIRKFNEGNFMMTFFGHGNPVQLTHEQLLLLQDLPSLNAGYKNPLALFLSCKVGAFARENPPFGIGEYMALYPQAIATVASTIGQYVTLNYLFGRNIHSVLSDRNLHTLGEVLTRAKLTSLMLSYYHLFGDPATIIYLPAFDSLTLFNTPDTLWIGNVNTAKITSGDLNSEYYTAFYHKPYWVTYVNPYNSNVRTTYLGENKALFRGLRQLRGLPDSIKFFLSGTADTGTGFCFALLRKDILSKRVFASYKPNLFTALGNITTTDREGPKIRVFIDGREVDSVAYTGLNFELKVELTDSSGINLFNVFGEEKGIMLLDGTTFIDLTPYFEYYPNSYTQGTLTCLYSSPTYGEKELKIVAYDNLNNFSQKTFKVKMQEQQALVEDLVIYPNPVKGDVVYFSFRTSEPVKVKVQIFTVSGRLIYQIPEVEFSRGFGQISWNLRDFYGDVVSNGLYMVKFNFEGQSGVKQSIVRGFVKGK